MRLFVAIALPDNVRARLAGLAGGIPGARWITAENMHLTLRFIGEVPAADLPDIAGELSRIASPAFDLTLAQVGHFGPARKARSLWVGVVPNPGLMALQERVDGALRRAGLPPEDRKFVPHVTLARLNGASPPRLQSYVEANNLFRAGPFPVEEFVLFSSRLGSERAVYQAEAEFPLQIS